MERALPLAKGIEERKRRDTSSQETQSTQGVPRVPQEFPLPQREICGVSETSLNCSKERTLKICLKRWNSAGQDKLTWLTQRKDGSSFFGRGWDKLLGKVIGMWAVLFEGARVNRCLLFALHGISGEGGGCTQENAHWFYGLKSKHISLQKPSSILHSDCIRCTQMPPFTLTMFAKVLTHTVHTGQSIGIKRTKNNFSQCLTQRHEFCSPTAANITRTRMRNAGNLLQHPQKRSKFSTWSQSSTKWKFLWISASSLLSNHKKTNLSLINLGNTNSNFFVLPTYVSMYTGAASSIQRPEHEFLRGLNIYVKNHSAQVLD